MALRDIRPPRELQLREAPVPTPPAELGREPVRRAHDYLSEPEVRRRRSFVDTKRYLEVHWRPVHGMSAETIAATT